MGTGAEQRTNFFPRSLLPLFFSGDPNDDRALVASTACTRVSETEIVALGQEGLNGTGVDVGEGIGKAAASYEPALLRQLQVGGEKLEIKNTPNNKTPHRFHCLYMIWFQIYNTQTKVVSRLIVPHLLFIFARSHQSTILRIHTRITRVINTTEKKPADLTRRYTDLLTHEATTIIFLYSNNQQNQQKRKSQTLKVLKGKQESRGRAPVCRTCSF